jgi:DNA (cytosine-5)-methyltransferase 1
MREMMFTAVDLFCGAGGLSLGLQQSGFNVLGALDSWRPAYECYRLNFNHRALKADIRELSAQDFMSLTGNAGVKVDLVAGGPPCQGFSVQRIGEDADGRNDLVLEFARFINELEPTVFLMENVLGLLGKRGEATAHEFEQSLRPRYHVGSARVNAADHGIPQLRRRVLYFGWKREIAVPFVLPLPTHDRASYITVLDAIGDLPDPPADYSAPPADSLHRRIRLSPKNLERLKLIPPGKGFESLPVEMRVDCHKEGPDRIGHRYVYGRLAGDEPAGTITARFDSFTRGKFAHPSSNRNISLREGARLQTFPDSFRFCGSQEEIAALIGNAVPPRLAQVVGKALYDYLAFLRSEPVTEVRDTSTGDCLDQLSLFSLPTT